MAWIEWHTTKKGARTATIRWRNLDGTKGRKALGVTTPRVAEIEREHTELLYEGTNEARLLRVDAVTAFEAYVAEMCETRDWTPATVSYTKQKVRPILDALGPGRWQRWKRLDLQRFLASDKRSPQGKRKALAALRRFLAWAVQRGAPVSRITEGITLPRSRPVRRSALSPSQVQAVLAKSRDHEAFPWLETPLALAAYAAFSWGDLQALRWGEVDLAAGLVRRRRKKTNEDMTIPLIEPLVAVLRREHMRQGRPRAGLVCRRMPKSHGSATKALRRVQAEAGIPPADRGQNGWHRYRRSLATLLRRQGVPGTVIGRILAHAPKSLQWIAYDVVDDDDACQAMRLAERALSPASRNEQGSV